MSDSFSSSLSTSSDTVADTVSTHQKNTADPLAAKADTTVAYTDGACKGNPGAGGWGAHLIYGDGHTQDLYGGEAQTTNNRMELMGAIKALEHSPKNLKLEIWTDSSYVKNGITEWIDNWKKRGWKTASKKPVANQDLWQQLDELRQERTVEWHWVKGHAGHAGNEKADELANLGVTSNSDTKKCKKKAHIAADDDWLHFDPLGFNMMEEADGLSDNLPLSETGSSNTVHTADNRRQPMHGNTMTADTVTADNNRSNNRMTETHLAEANTPAESAALPEFDGDTSRANPNFRPLLPEPIHRHESNRQLIMDTETTGLDALKGDRVIEVGIVELVGRKFTGEKLHVYINPERGMDEEVIRIHGISEAFLSDKPTFDQIAKPLYDFMDGAEIIAHNATFDMTFLSMEFDKVGLTDFAQRVKVTDSLALAKQQYPGQKNTLDALVRRLNVGKQDRTFHGALLDSEILAEVYLAMTGGQVALAIEDDAEADGGHTAHMSFASLAAMLVNSKADNDANQSWFASLADDYPEIKAKMSQW
ncbi:DNA polymerase III subunit epsilon [Psychrobacter sp. F1192]|uniref:Ribonuclease H n=1 Tax=Psychrobacter coccoides TaxID=2818440 RepID=A0ABS3NPU7_9GAMM|nr:DNA polymerase III subunit epsilon [Psychrobacter coccoides]MBO1531442.1 DNA polymerase III subunit epsilon [Psychrobacter coccoides]